MFVASRIEEIAGRLHGYQEQMAAITSALEALKVVGDLVSASLLEEQNALRGIVEQMQEASSDHGADAAIDSAICEAVAAGETLPPTLQLDVPEITGKTGETAFEAEVRDSEPASCEELPSDGNEAADPVADADADTEAVNETAAGAAACEPCEEIDAVSAEAAPALETSEPEAMIAQIADAARQEDAKVIDLASKRIEKAPKTGKPARRRAVGIVAAMLLAAAGTVGMQELLQSDVAQQMIGIGACDGRTVVGSRECAVLAWLML